MGNRNVTLSLPEEDLRRARIIAAHLPGGAAVRREGQLEHVTCDADAPDPESLAQRAVRGQVGDELAYGRPETVALIVRAWLPVGLTSVGRLP